MEVLKFRPILKTIVWGGEKIAPYKCIHTDQQHIGESWELSGVKGNESIVQDGRFAGKSISEMAAQFREQLLGKHVWKQFGTEFPLLIKFIDARADLSIQVHPNDELAAARHNGSRGKTEMWYVIDTVQQAHLISGLSKNLTREEYVHRVENGSITEVLNRCSVKPGDVFFLPAGRIHAICSGCVIAEIQQTSDITYRISDYGRLGLDGKPRQLHVEESKDAVDLKATKDYRTEYKVVENSEVVIADCKYFTTSLYELTEPVTKDMAALDSFMVVICISGYGWINGTAVHQGETVLVSADARRLELVPEGRMKVLTSHC